MSDIDIEQKEQGGGKAKSPPRKQCPFWKCNRHLKDGETIPKIFEQLEQVFGFICSSYIFSEELGSSGNTLHIEGYMIFEKKVDFNAIQKLFKFSDLQASKKCNSQAGIKYCLKEGLRNIKKNIKVPKPVVKMTYEMLRSEQAKICDMFIEDEDPLFGRKVYWFWESPGCWGKSITCKYMIHQMGAMVVEGANNDVLCGVAAHIQKFGECPRIIIFDVPRVNEGAVSYRAIEKLKSGFFFSGKYESGMEEFNVPHVLVFANHPPIIENFTKDRWIVEKLVKCNCYNYKGTEGGPLEFIENTTVCRKCGQ